MKNIPKLVFIILVLSILLMLKSSNEPFLFNSQFPIFNQFPIGNSIVLNISLGLFVSALFYYFTVFIPDYRKRKIIKNNYLNQYKHFKQNMISHFLSACETSYPSDLVDTLLDQKEFKSYFSLKATDSEDKWHVVLNKMDHELLEIMLLEFEAFKESTGYVLNNIEFNQPDSFEFFHHFNKQIVLLKNITDDYDEIKSFSRFLWSLFAGWCWIEGYAEKDRFQEMIDSI